MALFSIDVLFLVFEQIVNGFENYLVNDMVRKQRARRERKLKRSCRTIVKEIKKWGEEGKR
jgi:hypothetical protein